MPECWRLCMPGSFPCILFSRAAADHDGDGSSGRIGDRWLSPEGRASWEPESQRSNCSKLSLQRGSACGIHSHTMSLAKAHSLCVRPYSHSAHKFITTSTQPLTFHR